MARRVVLAAAGVERRWEAECRVRGMASSGVSHNMPAMNQIWMCIGNTRWLMHPHLICLQRVVISKHTCPLSVSPQVPAPARQ